MAKPTTTELPWNAGELGPLVIQFENGRLAPCEQSTLFATYVLDEAEKYAAELRADGMPCRVRRAKRIVVEL